MTEKKPGYDRFVRSITRNLRYWRRKIDGANTEQLQVQRDKFLLVCRAVRVALKEEQTAEEAAQLVVSASRFAEQCSNWTEWLLVLNESIAQLDDQFADVQCALNLELGKFFRLDHQLQEAIEAYSLAMNSAESLNNRHAYATAVVGLSTCHLDKGENDNAERYLTQSMRDVVAACEDEIVIARMENSLGRLCYVHKKELALATSHFEESLRYYLAVEDPLNASRILHNLGLLTHSKGDTGAAIDYLQRALQLQIECGTQVDLAHTKSSIGAMHYARGDWAAAVEGFRSIDLSFLERNKYTRIQAAVLNNLGNALSKLGQYKSARQMLEQSKQLWLELDMNSEYANTVSSIGETYKGEKNWPFAVECFEEAVQLLQLNTDNIYAERWLQNNRKLLTEAQQILCQA